MNLYRCTILASCLATAVAFAPRLVSQSPHQQAVVSSTTLSMAATATESTKDAVAQLKKVLEREYVSFFDPMRTEFYENDVTFDDPLNDLAGVQAYQANVDMLGSRTLLGGILFKDAGIVLHSVEGGEVKEDKSIDDIITRWTLRFTFKILPWAPTARFSGISEYKVKPGGPEGVVITAQTDYWDSINMVEGGSYQKVDKSVAVQDFIQQLQPGGVQAQSAAPELPYSLLRRGKDYEVRRYPSYSAVKIKYERRDEGFASLGAFTQGMNPLAPALMEVTDSDKSMMWPLSYAAPGEDKAPTPQAAVSRSKESQWSNDVEIVAIPSQVMAVAEFTDASMEPVVRKADADLRASLQRDGLVASPEFSNQVNFAQYDAIFSMGKRRGEVWIPLKDGGHPW